MHPIPTQDLPAVVTPQAVLRPLGALERWYWLMEAYRPSNSARVLWIGGKRDRAAWERGLSELQIRHALLNAFIAEQPGGAPCFVRDPEAPIPLIVKPRLSPQQWRAEMAEQYATPFDTSRAPLIRIVILEGQDSCDLIVTFHHSIADGLSCLQFLRDLLQAVDGEVLEPLDVPPSLDDLLVQSAHERRAQSAVSPRRISFPVLGPVELRPRNHERPSIRNLRLSREDTASLVLRARHENSSLHAAISAALVLAGQWLSFAWRNGTVRVFSPISLHQLLHIEYECVVGVTGGIVACPPLAEMTLWSLARMLKQDLKQFQNLAGAAAANSRLRYLMMQNPEPSTVARTYAKFSGYELMISNTGVSLLNDSGELAVRALWGPLVVNGLENEQSVGVAMTGGRIHMLHASYCPLEGLLQAAEALLIHNSR